MTVDGGSFQNPQGGQLKMCCWKVCRLKWFKVGERFLKSFEKLITSCVCFRPTLFLSYFKHSTQLSTTFSLLSTPPSKTNEFHVYEMRIGSRDFDKKYFLLSRQPLLEEIISQKTLVFAFIGAEKKKSLIDSVQVSAALCIFYHFFFSFGETRNLKPFLLGVFTHKKIRTEW